MQARTGDIHSLTYNLTDGWNTSLVSFAADGCVPSASQGCQAEYWRNGNQLIMYDNVTAEHGSYQLAPHSLWIRPGPVSFDGAHFGQGYYWVYEQAFKPRFNVSEVLERPLYRECDHSPPNITITNYIPLGLGNWGHTVDNLALQCNVSLACFYAGNMELINEVLAVQYQDDKPTHFQAISLIFNSRQFHRHKIINKTFTCCCSPNRSKKMNELPSIYNETAIDETFPSLQLSTDFKVWGRFRTVNTQQALNRTVVDCFTSGRCASRS